MPTKDDEKIIQEVVYIDGKPIKEIQEIRAQQIKVKRSFVYKLAELIKLDFFIFMFKLSNGRKGR